MIQFSSLSRQFLPEYSMHFAPVNILRPTEFFCFKGSHTPAIDPAQSVFSIPNLRAPSEPYLMFDSRAPSAPNRVALLSPLSSSLISFSDLSVEYSSLSPKLVSPLVADCVAADKLGNCLKCAHGFTFDAGYSSCTKCPEQYLAFLGQCTSLQGSSDDVSKYALMTGSQSTKITATANAVTRNLSYISYFGDLQASFENSLKASLPYDDQKTTMLEVTLNLQLNSTPASLMIPSLFYSFYSVYPFVLFQVFDDVSLWPNDRVELRHYISMNPGADQHTWNYMMTLPLPNPAVYSFNLQTDLRVQRYTFDHSSMISDYWASNQGLLPIEAKTFDLVSDRFGPFHQRYFEISSSALVNTRVLSLNQLFRVKIDCSDACLNCLSSDFCVSCQSGYFLDPNTSRCVACSNECVECERHPKRCLKCFESSFLLDPSKSIFL